MGLRCVQGRCGGGGDGAFVGQLEVPGTLDQAVEALGTGGRVILLAVGGPAKKIPFLVTNALGVAYEACTHGAPGTLLLGLSKEVCDFATRQQVRQRQKDPPPVWRAVLVSYSFCAWGLACSWA